MKILFVCAFLNQHGGFENYVEALAETALGAGHEVEILTPFEVVDDATIRRVGIPVTSLQERWRCTFAGRLVHGLARLRYLVRHRRRPTGAEAAELGRDRSRPWVGTFWAGPRGRELMRSFDLVHLVGKPKSHLVEAAACARRSGKPVVYSEVAHVDRDYALEPEHRRFVEAAHLCDLVLTYSRLQLDGMRRFFGYEGPAHIVEQWAYGVEDELLSIARDDVRGKTSRAAGEKDSAEQIAGSEEVVVGTLCRLSPEKDLPLLIQAFAAARRRHPGLRLRIAGTGALASELVGFAGELGVDEATHFLGFVQDKASFYSAIDVFVVSSRVEGGPITGVEAMAAGLPVVSTPVNAMPERLGPAEALFFEVGDRAALADALCRLAADRALRARLGRAARRRYAERCHSDVCAPELRAAWEQALALGREGEESA